jgi:mono/diheme cytochrome c family protein
MTRSQWSRLGLLLVFLPLGIGLLSGHAAPPTSDGLDEEERAERRELARRLVQENCLICHSEEIIARERLTPAQWKTEVEKMVGWGAPLAKEQEPSVIEFLTDQYTPETPLASPARLSYEEAMATIRPEPASDASPRGDADRGSALFTSHCATCHGPAARGGDLGPNLVEVPILLRPTAYRDVLRNGRHRMPGFQAILKPEQEDDLLGWLRRQRYGSPSP